MTMDRINQVYSYLNENVKTKPDVCVVLGSGLGSYADTIEDAQVLDYKNIPGFPVSTVPGHAGRLVFGKKHGVNIACMQGRVHCYEGYSTAETVIPLRALIKLGVKKLLMTNAAGGVNMDFSPGDIMLIRDHINFTSLTPLEGPNLDEFGPRFPDMSYAYDKELIAALDAAAKDNNIPVQKGVYMMLKGPSFETPSEIKAVRILGADAVGMSTVPEILAAAHAGVKSCAMSCITNMAAGILDQPLNHEEVMETGAIAADNIKTIIDGFIQRVG
ncbi:MAG: purine-nucleoside phosphorylase [Clostridia bacterium]|jgi:purine-nucleoside phosphorylase|nr:purine-nucleoside phosphorylase [Clostridia bacterium]MBT7121731.1 purine-nucleoside phosphorylase [Clostridia bacterium]